MTNHTYIVVVTVFKTIQSKVPFQILLHKSLAIFVIRMTILLSTIEVSSFLVLLCPVSEVFVNMTSTSIALAIFFSFHIISLTATL